MTLRGTPIIPQAALPYDDPFDPDEEFDRWLDAADRGLNSGRKAVARSERRERHLESGRREVHAVTRNLIVQQRAGGRPHGTVSVAPAPAEKEPMMSIFEPSHNGREIAKQLVLLEDHIITPPRHCPDCIRKHLLTAEALAEEAVGLARQQQDRRYFQGIAREVRDLSRGYVAKADRGELQQAAREIRKRLSKHSFDAIGSAQKAPAPVTRFADLKGGENVILRHPTDGWERGQVLSPGDRYVFRDEWHTVETVPDKSGYLGYAAKKNGATISAWVPVGPPAPDRAQWLQRRDLVVIGANPLSLLLRGRTIQLFDADGSVREVYSLAANQGEAAERRLALADTVEALVAQNFDGKALCRAAGVKSAWHQDGLGCSRRIVQQIVRALVVNSLYQTGLAVMPADALQATGLWATAYPVDPHPTADIRQFKTQIEKAAAQAGPVRDLVVAEANMHPTSPGEWTAALAAQLLSTPADELGARQKTADALFGVPRVASAEQIPLWRQGADFAGHGAGAYFRRRPNLDLQGIDNAVRKMAAWQAVAKSERVDGLSALTPRQLLPIQQAASAWLYAARQHRDLFPAVRAAALAIAISDSAIAKDALGYISREFPSTPQGIEATQVLERYQDSTPAMAPAPARLTPTQKGIGLVFLAGMVALGMRKS